MKRFLSLSLCLVFAAVMLLGSVSIAVAETLTLSAGVYNVGKDIPAGEYEILCTEASDPYNDYLDLMKSLSDDESLQSLWNLYGSLAEEPTITVTIRGTSGETKKKFQLEKNEKKTITLQDDYSIKIEDGTCTLELKKEIVSTASGNDTGRSATSSDEWECPNCSNIATGNFCNNCGTARPESSPDDSALSENDDIVGTWLATHVVYNGVTVDISSYDMSVTMQLNANGSATIITNDGEEEGTWVRNSNALTVTTDESGAISGTIDDSVITLNFSGNSIIFGRELTNSSVSLPSPITATSEEEFYGTWNMSRVAAQGIVLTPVELAAMGSNEDITLTISNGNARADIVTNGRQDYNEFNTSFSNGRLQLKSKYNSVVLSVILTDSGELFTTITSDGVTRQIYFTKESDGKNYSESNAIETKKAESSTPSPAPTVKPTQKPTKKPSTIVADFSDTKHYQRIRNYVGMSLDDVGYTSMGGDRLEEYGKTHLKFNFVTITGEYIDIESEAQLANYTVIGQSIEPDTPLVITYQKNSSGREYDNLIDWQSIDQIDLYVVPKGQSATLADFPVFVENYTSPDKYIEYVRNYVGKNLASVGYTSMGGDRLDEYGKVYLKLELISLDGEYIDIQDTSALSEYMAIAQNVEPNTEFKVTYQKNSSGEEYSNLIDWQGLTSIEIYVTKVGTDLSTISLPQIVTVEPSQDKYTERVRNYVGKNLASFGYTSMGGDRLEEYGKVYIEFSFITPDGEYIDIENADQLQQYYVVAQSIAPNTEFKITYQKNSQGEEYSNLTEWQGIKNIDLLVARRGSSQTSAILPEITQIQASPDKHTWHLRNYVGMNLAGFGYTSWGGKRMEEYGAGYIEFKIVSENGETIEIDDVEKLKNYVVIKQDVEPNTPIELTFSTNSRGEEYSNLVRNQSLEKVTLTVRKIEVKQSAVTEEPTNSPTEAPATEMPSTVSEEPSYSASDVRTSGKFKYVVLAGGNAQIVRYTGQESSVSISSSLDGHDITSIGAGAFKDCTSLKNITIWADIVDFGDEAFMGCSNLKKISIPAETKKIGKNAFKDCEKLESVTVWGDLDGIRESTFENCKALKKISISSTAKFIEKRAFYGCEKMTSAIIWGDPEYIGESAFEGCTALQKISIPSSTKRIEDCAFKGCSSMSSVTIWGDTNIGNYAFQGCEKISKINISSGTEYIGDYAFEGCTNLSKVTMWGRNTTIGVGAFDNCPNLSNPPMNSKTDKPTPKQADSTPTPKPTPTLVPTSTPASEESGKSEQTEENNNSNDSSILYTGEYIIGKDLNPGRYVVAVQNAFYSEFLNRSYIEYEIAEYNDSEGKWKKLQVEDLHEAGETASFSLLEGQKLTVYNGEFIILQHVDLDQQNYGPGNTLYSGEYLVGTDIPAGRYIVSVKKAIYSEFLNRSYIEYQIAEYDELKEKWEKQQVEDLHETGETASFSLVNGQKLSVFNGEFVILQHVDIDQQKYGPGDTLYSGEYLVGADIPAGRYVVSVQKAIYSDFLNRSYIEYQIAEYDESKGKWEKQEVKDLHSVDEKATFTLKEGQKFSVFNGEFLVVEYK